MLTEASLSVKPHTRSCDAAFYKSVRFAFEIGAFLASQLHCKRQRACWREPDPLMEESITWLCIMFHWKIHANCTRLLGRTYVYSQAAVDHAYSWTTWCRTARTFQCPSWIKSYFGRHCWIIQIVSSGFRHVTHVWLSIFMISEFHSYPSRKIE